MSFVRHGVGFRYSMDALRQYGDDRSDQTDDRGAQRHEDPGFEPCRQAERTEAEPFFFADSHPHAHCPDCEGERPQGTGPVLVKG